MKRKRTSTVTPKSQIVHALRLLWLRSRERSTALKAAGYACEACHAKQSARKGHEVRLEVHHRRDDLDWDKIVDYLRRNLLCEPKHLVCLCKLCHKREHDNG